MRNPNQTPDHQGGIQALLDSFPGATVERVFYAPGLAATADEVNSGAAQVSYPCGDNMPFYGGRHDRGAVNGVIFAQHVEVDA